MAVRGTEAKNYVAKKLKEAFGDDFLGEIGGKVYLKAPEDGGKIQVAISMSCPKGEVNLSAGKSGGAFSLEDIDASLPTKKMTIAEPQEYVTSEETERIKKLLAELGL